MSEVVLIVDSRETNSRIPGFLRQAGVPFEMRELPVGDFCIGPYLIERKSVNDLAASIMDGRLFPQAEALAAACESPVLLIEGNLDDVRSTLHEDSLPGAVSALSIFWKLNVISMPNAAASARLLARMRAHLTDGLGYEVALRVSKPKPTAPDGAGAQFLVEGLSGVGPELARNLLRHFGTPRDVFAASREQLLACKGVGPKTADAIICGLDARPTGFRSTKSAG
jgi:DNA excision repair protein ERCC-4